MNDVAHVCMLALLWRSDVDGDDSADMLSDTSNVAVHHTKCLALYIAAQLKAMTH